MIRHATVALAIIVLVLGAGSAEATICSYDAVPAATLLFPFVSFDYNQPISGQTTILGITNTGAKAQIVHVRIWSDTGIPVLGFNIVLSGYDVQTIDLRDILYFGVLPDTGTYAPYVVSGSVSEAGPVDGEPNLPLPQGTNALYQRCNPSSMGYPVYPTMPQVIVDQIQALLQVSQSQDYTRLHNDCVNPAGYSVGSWFESRTTADTTWMYVTADVVWTCTRLLPDDASYWQDGPSLNPSHDPEGAQRLHANVLMGDVTWVDEILRFSEGSLAVHIEADPGLGDTSVNTPIRNPSSGLPQSFYHFYAAPHGVSDNREPLPTAWAVRYMDDGSATHSRLRVWKAPTSTPDLAFDSIITGQYAHPWVLPEVALGSDLQAYDCLAYTYYAWDEDEDVVSGGIEPNFLPLYTQEVPVSSFALPGYYGWMLFLWPRSNTSSVDPYQTWMGVRFDAYGDYSVALPATAVENFNCQP